MWRVCVCAMYTDEFVRVGGEEEWMNNTYNTRADNCVTQSRMIYTAHTTKKMQSATHEEPKG